MMPGSHTKKWVAQAAGLDYRLVQHYTDQGVVVPVFDPAMRRGVPRRYTWQNIFQLRMVRELRRWGVSIAVMRKIIAVMPQFEQPPREHYVVMYRTVPEECYTIMPLAQIECDIWPGLLGSYDCDSLLVVWLGPPHIRDLQQLHKEIQ